MKATDFYNLQGWINSATIKGVEILSKDDAIKFAERYHDMMINSGIKEPRNAVSAKMIEAEEYVDSYIEKNGKPPTYNKVAEHFNLSSKGLAHHRLRRYHHKMKNNKA